MWDERQKCFISGWGDINSRSDTLTRPDGLQKSEANLVNLSVKYRVENSFSKERLIVRESSL